MLLAKYDSALVENIATMLDLRKPNRDALDAIAKAMGDSITSIEVVADLATGVGKTYIAGALLDYLYESGVRNVVIITPGSTIFDKTINNLDPSHPKYLKGMRCNPLVVTLDDFQRGTVAAALADGHRLKVFVFTVQSLLRPDTASARRAHRAQETLGLPLYEYLQNADDLVVIADEHHSYYGKQFSKAVRDLTPAALIGLTATPDPSTPAEMIIYKYPLADAIADGFVKIPVLVARRDAPGEQRQQLGDALALLEAKRSAMNAYCLATRQTFIQPVLFVVADKIEAAERIAGILAAPDMLDGVDKVLVVTSASPDEDLRALQSVEDAGSPIRAIVSVSMLKEGWDVKNIYVIYASRALESKILTEQILGRGLRLPFGRRTGQGMIDTVEVLSHHKFRDLLAEAEVLLAQTLAERSSAAIARLVTTPGTAGTQVVFSDTVTGDQGALGLADQAVQSGADQVIVTLPGRIATEGLFELDPEPGENEHAAMIFATTEQRLAQSAADLAAMTTPMQARIINGVRIPLYLPRVETSIERERFTLTAIPPTAVEAIGRRFANQHESTLRRVALDSERDLNTGVVTSVVRELVDDQVNADQIRIEYGTIETDLVRRLVLGNFVEAKTSEQNAAKTIAAGFMIGAQVTPATHWSPEHARLAASGLETYISEQYLSRPVVQRINVTVSRWPEPPRRTLTTAPVDRNRVGSSRDFVRNQPYQGWSRSVYEAASFDAYSTEFRLAELLDVDPHIKAWTRIDNNVPLRVAYKDGTRHREYMPDFLVVTTDDIHWIIEGKADDEMSSEIVRAKRDATRTWLAHVNSSNDVPDTWAYVLASETVIKNVSGSWDALLNAAQTIR